MRKRMIQLVFAILGISIGYSFLPPLWESLRVGNHLLQSPVINSFIGLLVMLILAVFLVDPIENIIKKFEKSWHSKNRGHFCGKHFSRYFIADCSFDFDNLLAFAIILY